MRAWKEICTKQFQLVYHGHLSYAELDELSVYEREVLYGILIDQKTDERESYEKAVNESKRKK